MQITNRGLNTQFCTLHMVSVNDDICSNCPDREGVIPIELKTLDFPKRNPKEIEAIYNVCKSCPLLNAKTKICDKMHAEMHPTDIVAQHPSSHCPEGKW